MGQLLALPMSFSHIVVCVVAFVVASLTQGCGEPVPCASECIAPTNPAAKTHADKLGDIFPGGRVEIRVDHECALNEGQVQELACAEAAKKALAKGIKEGFENCFFDPCNRYNTWR